MKKGKIYGVSLGPGDPGLITVKGFEILKTADKIYYAGSLLDNNETTSFSIQILRHYQLDETKLEGMFLKMSDNREEAQPTYLNTFHSMKKDYENGLKVAFVSEGDISFYSTFSYLLKYIQENDLEVEIVAGVPSFLLGAAEQKLPLALLNEKIAILPRAKDIQQLERYLEEFEAVVLIKIRSVLKEIIHLITNKKITVVYCERLGTADQFITTNIDEIQNREIPYFSLLILKKLS